MTTQDIYTGFVEILAEVAGTDPARVTMDSHLSRDLEIDSLSLVEVAAAAEDRFGVEIRDLDLDELNTVSDAVAYIARAVPVA